MGKLIKINNNNQKQKQMEDLRIKTPEEMQTENQEEKSQLVERIDNDEISEALSLMKYEDKYFLGFMGAMMTEPTTDKEGLIELATGFTKEGWSLLLNMFTHMIKNRKLIDNLNSKDDE